MHVFLFDIDGTLIRTGGAGRAAMEAALVSLFGSLEPTDGVPFSGRTDRAIARNLLALYGIENSPEHVDQFLAGYLNQLPKTLAAHRGEVLPGIAALLDQLSAHEQATVGLLTGNTHDGARHKLTHYELYHHFQFGGYGDRYEDRNDVARAAFEEARRHLGRPVEGDRIWVIGDSPHDVRCARSIGARAVAVATGWNTVEELEAEQPDLLLLDLADASPLLNEWTGAS